MAQIKDTNVIRTPEVTVNPVFFLPDGVIDVRVKERNERIVGDGTEIDFEFDADDVTGEDAQKDDDFGGEEDESPGASLKAPSWLVVVEQIVRVAPDGRTTVDVTLEVENIPGALNYEVRLAK